MIWEDRLSTLPLAAFSLPRLDSFPAKDHPGPPLHPSVRTGYRLHTPTHTRDGCGGRQGQFSKHISRDHDFSGGAGQDKSDSTPTMGPSSRGCAAFAQREGGKGRWGRVIQWPLL